MMKKAIATLSELFRERIPETHYIWNYSNPVKYPYMTFGLTTEDRRRAGVKGFYIECDIFDIKGSDHTRIEEALGELIDLVDNEESWVLTDDFLIQFDSISTLNIPTQSDNLQRRNVRIYARIDRRR